MSVHISQHNIEISSDEGATSIKISRELSALLAETSGKYTLVLAPADQATVDNINYRKSIKRLIEEIKAFGGSNTFKLAPSSTSNVYLALSTMNSCGRVISNFKCAPGTALEHILEEMRTDPHFVFVSHEQLHNGEYLVYKSANKQI